VTQSILVQLGEIKLNFHKITTRKWTNDEFVIVDVQRDDSNPNILRYSLIDSYNYPMQEDKKPLSPLIKFAKLKDIKAVISLPAYYSLVSNLNNNTRVALPRG